MKMMAGQQMYDSGTSSQRDDNEEFSGRSTLSTIGDLSEINPSDFDVQQILGQGAFSDVLEVTFRSNSKKRDVLGAHHPSSFSSSQCCSSFALKCSKFNDMVSPEMINEASILSKLDHKNIIKAIGVSRLPPMLLLELLECTLEERIEYWREEQHKSIKFASRLFGGRTQRRMTANEFQIRTQRTVFGIVLGLDYLHSQNIVLRDLKPQNIGFDSRGEVKLFDFEFACYVVSDDEQGPAECTNNINTIAGSLRYMPPESLNLYHTHVLNKQRRHRLLRRQQQQQFRHGELSFSFDGSYYYDSDDEEDGKPFCCGFSSDVYALGIVLWEIGTLQKAYSSLMTSAKHQNHIYTFYKKVSLGGYRPKMRKIPNTQFRKLVEKCWHSRAPIRPTLPYILEEWLPKVYPQITLVSPSPSPADDKRKTSTRSSTPTEQTSSKSTLHAIWEDIIPKCQNRRSASASPSTSMKLAGDTSRAMLNMSVTSKIHSSSSFYEDGNAEFSI